MAAIVYVPYSRNSPQGASGGTTMGLIYGSVAFAIYALRRITGCAQKSSYLAGGTCASMDAWTSVAGFCQFSARSCFTPAFTLAWD